jgi:membrane-associated phospholipid phosphatase
MNRPARIALTCVIALAVTGAQAGCAEKPGGSGAPPSPPVAEWHTWALGSPHDVVVAASPMPRLALSNSELARTDRWRGRTATEPWMRLNLALVSSSNIDPPRAARAYALTSVAMNDAVVTSAYGHAHPRPGRSFPAEDAAVAGAASRVLAYLFPHASAARLDRLAEVAASTRSGPGRAAAEGLALGRAVANKVIARARRDGSARRWHGALPPGPGTWRPAPGQHSAPEDPLAGSWRTWVLRSGSELRPPPPPAYDSPRFRRDALELVHPSAPMTLERQRIAWFWAGGVGSPLPPGVWNEVALAYMRRDRLNTAQAARALALLNVAMADTGIATWDVKFAYWGERPVNAIRDLGIARHWKPFLPTPSFPGYVSAHSAFSGAASEVLAALFPTDARSFRAKAVEAGVSRLYGGIHFRADHEQGLILGRRIGRLVISKAGVGPLRLR